MSIYEALDPTETFEEAIQVLQDFEGDWFHDYSHQPECVVFRFGVIDSNEASILAETINDCLGDIVLCSEESFCENEPLTLLDVLEARDDWSIPVESQNVIIQAFIDTGFKRSNECSMTMLRNMFLANGYHIDAIDAVFMYDFERMNKEHAWLRKEIQEYLFSPDRIQKWIEAGYEIEDYLM